MRGARGQFEQLRKRADLFTCARAEQTEANGQIVKRRMIAGGLRVADRTQRSARRIQMLWRRWEHPVLDLIENFLLLLRLLDFGKTGDVGMRLQLGWQRAIGAQKENSNFLQARFAEHRHEPRPPFGIVEILARKGELLEVVLQQQPGALRIGASRESAQKFFTLGHALLGIGELAPQIGERAVSFGKHGVVSIVLRGAWKTRTPSVFSAQFWHGLASENTGHLSRHRMLRTVNQKYSGDGRARKTRTFFVLTKFFQSTSDLSAPVQSGQTATRANRACKNRNGAVLQ